MTATNICYNFVGFRCSPPHNCWWGIRSCLSVLSVAEKTFRGSFYVVARNQISNSAFMFGYPLKVCMHTGIANHSGLYLWQSVT